MKALRTKHAVMGAILVVLGMNAQADAFGEAGSDGNEHGRVCKRNEDINECQKRLTRERDERNAAQQRIDAPLKVEWNASGRKLIVKMAEGESIALEQARDKIMRNLVTQGAVIAQDTKYQIIATTNYSADHPIASTFMIALAGDPLGGNIVQTMTFSFIVDDDGRMTGLRVCATVGQQNRFGGPGMNENSCTMPFKVWKQGHELITGWLDQQQAKESAAVEGAKTHEAAAEGSGQ
jgi:hypothetical protein